MEVVCEAFGEGENVGRSISSHWKDCKLRVSCMDVLGICHVCLLSMSYHTHFGSLICNKEPSYGSLIMGRRNTFLQIRRGASPTMTRLSRRLWKERRHQMGLTMTHMQEKVCYYWEESGHCGKAGELQRLISVK